MTHKKSTGPTPETGTPYKTPTASIFQQNEETTKRFANARAKLAMIGVSVRRVEAGGYFVSGRNFATYCQALEDLEAFVGEVK
jgi:hypothetical protein